jgi:2-oxoisovalerate dehydrogenase E2 component (dihydrolipoyl transacylase)
MQNNDGTNSGGTAAKVLMSPLVHRLGRENNIDLGTIMGTGPGGRVLKADVLRVINPALSSMAASALSSRTSTSSTETTAPMRGAGAPRVGGAAAAAAVPIRGFHRLMVKSMTSSLHVPRMVYSDEANVGARTAVRDSLRPTYVARHAGNGDRPERKKLTYMPFFVKAASLALTAYPVLNSTIDVREMTLRYHDEHQIGIAVDTPRGLAVPVVGGCRDQG